MKTFNEHRRVQFVLILTWYQHKQVYILALFELISLRKTRLFEARFICKVSGNAIILNVKKGKIDEDEYRYCNSLKTPLYRGSESVCSIDKRH